MTGEPCPLCQSQDVISWHEDARRSYLRCSRCALVFAARLHWLTWDQERREYDKHQNDPADPGYRRFLRGLADPMLERLSPGSRGLDFGCGPGPTLSVLMEERGHRVALYDPIYAPDPSVLGETYDFVTSSEVLEHCHNPLEELERMRRLVASDGWLGLMTGLVADREAFTRWHYIRERSHICFFSRDTFLWVGRRWGVAPVFLGGNVILFHLP